MGEDTAQLVSPGRTRRSSSYTEPSSQPQSFTYSGPLSSSHYRAGLGGGCCHLEDTAALRMIVVWMATVAVVVFVALVVEIINQEHVVKVGDVVSDHPSCSSIGSSILALGGNAVDASVAAALCLTAALPHSVGLGGGGIMLVHDLRRNRTRVIDFLEKSPASLDFRKYTEHLDIIKRGAKSVAVPGLLAGLRLAHQKYGSGAVRRECCGWGDLLRDTITMLSRGFPLSGDWAEVKQRGLQEAVGDQEFRDFLKADGYSSPTSPASKALLATLKAIFEQPTENFYKGRVARRLVSDLEGQLSSEDLEDYAVLEREAVQVRVGDYDVVTSPSPSAGPELLALLGAIEALHQDGEATFESGDYLSSLRADLETVHGQARLLGDPANDQEHEGEPGFVSVGERTASLLDRRSLGRWRGQGGDGRDAWQTGSHLAVMDDQDLYVSTVLSLGGQFGSRTFSQGFLLNNALASFDLSQLLAEGGETASSNLLSEGRRPLSRMAPVVAVSADTCGLRILTGGALAEVTAQVLAPVLLSPNGDMNRALRTPKLVMVNGTARAEPGLNPAVVQQLNRSETVVSLEQGFSPTSALEKDQNRVTGFTDHRGGQQEDGRWATLTPKYIKT